MPYAELFSTHRLLRAVIEAGVEGRLGRMYDDGADPPRAARLDIGCYAIFGGACGPAALPLIRSAPAPCELILPPEQSWRDAAQDCFGDRLSDWPMRTFATHHLDETALRQAVQALPAGLDLRPFDADLAAGLDEALEPHALQVFPSAERFLADGCGFGIVDGSALVCAATSYTRSSRRVEIAIATRASHRGMGLARIAAARLVLHCLASGLTPDWTASNPVSKRLAARLGYRRGPLSDSLMLAAE